MRLWVLTMIAAIALVGLTSGCSKTDTPADDTKTPAKGEGPMVRKDKRLPPPPEPLKP